MVRFRNDYQFASPFGTKTLLDLFDGRPPAGLGGLSARLAPASHLRLTRPPSPIPPPAAAIALHPRPPSSLLRPVRLVLLKRLMLRRAAKRSWRIRVMRRIWYPLGYQILH